MQSIKNALGMGAKVDDQEGTTGAHGADGAGTTAEETSGAGHEPVVGSGSEAGSTNTPGHHAIGKDAQTPLTSGHTATGANDGSHSGKNAATGAGVGTGVGVGVGSDHKQQKHETSHDSGSNPSHAPIGSTTSAATDTKGTSSVQDQHVHNDPEVSTGVAPGAQQKHPEKGAKPHHAGRDLAGGAALGGGGAAGAHQLKNHGQVSDSTNANKPLPSTPKTHGGSSTGEGAQKVLPDRGHQNKDNKATTGTESHSSRLAADGVDEKDHHKHKKHGASHLGKDKEAVGEAAPLSKHEREHGSNDHVHDSTRKPQDIRDTNHAHNQESALKNQTSGEGSEHENEHVGSPGRKHHKSSLMNKLDPRVHSHEPDPGAPGALDNVNSGGSGGDGGRNTLKKDQKDTSGVGHHSGN